MLIFEIKFFALTSTHNRPFSPIKQYNPPPNRTSSRQKKPLSYAELETHSDGAVTPEEALLIQKVQEKEVSDTSPVKSKRSRRVVKENIDQKEKISDKEKVKEKPERAKEKPKPRDPKSSNSTSRPAKAVAKTQEKTRPKETSKQPPKVCPKPLSPSSQPTSSPREPNSPQTETEQSILSRIQTPVYFPLKLLTFLESDEYRVYNSMMIPQIGQNNVRISVHETLTNFVSSEFDVMEDLENLILARDFEKMFDVTLPHHLLFRLEMGRFKEVYFEEESKFLNQQTTSQKSAGSPATDKKPPQPIQWSKLVSNQYLVRFLWHLSSDIESLAETPEEKNDLEDPLVRFISKLCSYLIVNYKEIFGEEGDEGYDSVSPEYWRGLAFA